MRSLYARARDLSILFADFDGECSDLREGKAQRTRASRSSLLQGKRLVPAWITHIPQASSDLLYRCSLLVSTSLRNPWAFFKIPTSMPSMDVSTSFMYLGRPCSLR